MGRTLPKRNASLTVATRTKKVDSCADAPGGIQIQDLFAALGRPHALDILHLFVFEEPGPRRFLDVQERLGLSPKTLTVRLKEFVGAGLLSRTAYAEIPPRVEYEATEKANELKTVFKDLVAWSLRYDLKPVVVAT